MLGVAYSNQNPRVWTEDEVTQLVLKSELPDHWNSKSVITYKLINHCIEIIKSSKLVMKYKLPQICELLSTSNNTNALSRIGVQPPLQPTQVRSFVAKVKGKMQLGQTICNSKAEFPKSPQGSGHQSRTQAWVNELGNNDDVGSNSNDWDIPDVAMPEVFLSEEMKTDLENVAEKSVLVLVELKDLMQGMDDTTEMYRSGEMTRDDYEKAVQEFKAAHQKNRVDDHHYNGRVDIIGVCCPIEVENKTLADRINEKFKKLVSEYYQALFNRKVLACEDLQGTNAKKLREREIEKIALINSVLNIEYNGEADPVDHAHFVKSFLEYVIGVVPKHVGKVNPEDAGETSGSGNHGVRPHRQLLGSPEWENSWQKNFEEAAADKRRLEGAAELKKKVGGMRNRMESLQNELAELKKEEELKRAELDRRYAADVRKREHEFDADVVRVPRKKKKKKEKQVPIFTGKDIAHLYENEQREKFFMDDDAEEPGAVKWMEATVLNPVSGQDMSNPEHIVYQVKYEKLDGIFELALGKDYLAGNINIRGEDSSSDDFEYDMLTLGEVRKQAAERMTELRQNMGKKKSKKHPKTTKRKSIPDFTGLKLSQCFNEDKDNIPLSAVQKKTWDDKSKYGSDSNVSVIRWMDATVLGPVPHQKSSDPYHTVYRVKYDELSEIYEVDLGRDYLDGTLICSDFSEPEPDELPLEEVLKEAKERMVALKTSAAEDQESRLKKAKERMVALMTSAAEDQESQLKEKEVNDHDTLLAEKQDAEKTVTKVKPVSNGRKSGKKGEKMSQLTPEQLAKNSEIKKLKSKILSLSCLERKRDSFREKRWKEKVKAKSDDVTPVVRQRREKVFDEAVQRLWDTRRELDSAKKMLEELGEAYASDNESDDDSFVSIHSNKKKRKYRSSSEERREKRREKRSAAHTRLDKLEKLHKEQQEISNHLYTEVGLAEDEDEMAKKAANVDYWLSSPSKEVKEKTALYDKSKKETDDTWKEIASLYDQLSDLSSSVSDAPKDKKSKKLSVDDLLNCSDSSHDTVSDKVKEATVKVSKNKKKSEEAINADEEQKEVSEEEEEQDSEQPQKSPEVMELESKINKLRAQERSFSAKRKQLAGAVTALKDFEKWQASSSRTSRRSTESTRGMNAQPSVELTKKQDLYFKTLQSLVDIRKEIRPLLKKLKEIGGELDSDWSDDNECEKDWITRREEDSSAPGEQLVPTQTGQIDDTQVMETESQGTSTAEESGQPEAPTDSKQVVKDEVNVNDNKPHINPLLVDENKNDVKVKIQKFESTCPEGSSIDCKDSVRIKDEFKMEQTEAMDIKPTKAWGKTESKPLDSQDQYKFIPERSFDAHVQTNQGDNNVENAEDTPITNVTTIRIEAVGTNQNNIAESEEAKRERQEAEKERKRIERQRLKAERAKQVAEMQKRREEEKIKKQAEAEALDERINTIKQLVQYRNTLNLHRWDEYLLQKRLEDKANKSSGIQLSSVTPSDELRKIEQLSIFASQKANAASAELKELRRRRNQIIISDSESSEEEESSSEEDEEDESGEEDTSDEDTDNEETSEDASEQRKKKAEIKELREKISDLKNIERSKDTCRKQRWKEVEDEEDFQRWMKSSRRQNRRSGQQAVTAPVVDSNSEPTKNDLYDLALKSLVETRKEIYPLQERLKELGAEVTIESDWIDDRDDDDEDQWVTNRGSEMNSEEASGDTISNDAAVREGMANSISESGLSSQDTQVHGFIQNQDTVMSDENSSIHQSEDQNVERTCQDLLNSRGTVDNTPNESVTTRTCNTELDDTESTANCQNIDQTTLQSGSSLEFKQTKDVETPEQNFGTHKSEDQNTESAELQSSSVQVENTQTELAASDKAKDREDNCDGGMTADSEKIKHATLQSSSSLKESQVQESKQSQESKILGENEDQSAESTCKDVPSLSEQLDSGKMASKECDGDGDDIKSTADCEDTDRTTSKSSDNMAHTKLKTKKNNTESTVRSENIDQTASIHGDHAAVNAGTISGESQVNSQTDEMQHAEKSSDVKGTSTTAQDVALPPDEDISIVPCEEKQVEMLDLTEEDANSEIDMDEEVQEKKTEEEKRKAKEIREKKRAEVDALEEKIDHVKQLLRRRTTISTHSWDEYELQKHLYERANNPESAGTSREFSSDVMELTQHLSMVASQRAEDACKEIKALRSKKNQIVISDSESSEEESAEDEEDSSEKESSDDEEDSSDDEESSDDDEEEEGPLTEEQHKEARRKELQDRFKKLSTLNLTRMNLKWKYHKEIQALKKSQYAASLTNVIKKKEKLYEGAVKRHQETCEEYDRHWKLMKEELSDYASSGENCS